MKQKRFLEIGKITNVHGLHGEIKVYPWCDDAAFLCSFEELYLDKNGKKSVQVQNARVQQNLVIMKKMEIELKASKASKVEMAYTPCGKGSSRMA